MGIMNSKTSLPKKNKTFPQPNIFFYFNIKKTLNTQGEVINLHIGQGGCQLGNACWAMYCLEHGIRPDGILCQKKDQAHPESFFYMMEGEKVVPRAAFIDLEPSAIDQIRIGKYRKLYNPQNLITGKEDTAGVFAKGYNTLAKEIIEVIFQRIRSLMNECDRPQGFLLSRTYGGGTGSGLASRVVERLHQEFPKYNLFEFALFPSYGMSSGILEPYNIPLATHLSLEHTSGTFILDNLAAYEICDRINACDTSYQSVNGLMGQIISTVTASFRFEGTVNVDFNETKTNLIPFPRLQYLVMSYAPLLPSGKVSHENITEHSLLQSCLEPSHQLVKCDTRSGMYMSCTVLFRGDTNGSSINAAIASVKAKKAIRFVDWCPTGFKIGVNHTPPVSVPGGDLGSVDKVCLMLANSTAIRSVFAKVNRKFDVLFSKKAFLHWYIAEGLEEGDFQETRLDMSAIEADYSEAAAER